MKNLNRRIEKLEEIAKSKENQEKYIGKNLDHFYEQVNDPESEANKLFYPDK